MAFAALGNYKITYVDGRVETARSNFLGLSEVEKRWPGEDVPVMEALAYSMWWYLDCPGEFEAFKKSVHLIEEDTPLAKVEDVADPTVPAVGAA